MAVPYLYVDRRENQQQRDRRRNGAFRGDRHKAEEFLPNMERIGLAEGDYVLMGDGGIVVAWERKKVREIAESIIHSNRHVEQLERCRAFYDVVYLIVEGEFRRGHDGYTEVQVWDRRLTERTHQRWQPLQPRLHYSALIKAMETLHRQLGVDVLYTGDYADTCNRILDLAEWWMKPLDEHTSAQRTPDPFVMLGRSNLVTRIAARFDGVGEVLAKRIGEKFESPQALHQATVADLLAIERMPRKTAEGFKRQWYRGK